ncbi:MAG: DUF4011 domain-containing protein, partial [Salinibacter sp.]
MSDIPEKIQNRLEDWQKSLIDLSLRNRLLNYRSRKRSTVEIVDELPQVTLRDLLRGETFVFDPEPDEDREEEGSQQEEGSDGEEDSGETSAVDGSPVPEAEESEEDGSPGGPEEESGPTRILETGIELTSVAGQDLADHHVDSRLQTPYTENRLSGKLLSLYRSAKSNIEEQGINTLYVALGMLEWYEDPNSDQVRRAPILLAPAQLTRETARSGFELSLGEGDTVLNPALREKLKREFEVDLPDLPELTDIGEVAADEVF